MGNYPVMKPQDFVFYAAYVILVFWHRPRMFLYCGLACFVLAIPLFSAWVFFTAERLTWYGSAFLLTYIFISSFRPHTVQ